jgi:DNA-binding response OmpR family regulator
VALTRKEVFMSSKVAFAHRGRNAHLPSQLTLPHVVVAGDHERDVRLAERALTNAGYSVTVVPAGHLPVPEFERRVEAIVRRRPTELMILACRDPHRSLLDVLEGLCERHSGLGAIVCAPPELHAAVTTRPGADVILPSPIDETELRRAARRLAPALPELRSNASA